MQLPRKQGPVPLKQVGWQLTVLALLGASAASRLSCRLMAEPLSQPSLLDAAALEADRPLRLHEVVFEGFERSDRSWALQYLGLATLPRMLSLQAARELGLKLMTTGVYSEVSVELVPIDKAMPFGGQRLVVRCVEKWTTIPVVRAQIGGGTPLQVLGAYDTHAWGSLYTLGGELRRYGKAPIGGVLYAKAPRAGEGRHYAGVELWRDFRRRTLFDRQERPQHELELHAWRLRSQWLWPAAGFQQASQLGLDIWLNRPTTMALYTSDAAPAQAPANSPRPRLLLTPHASLESLVLPTYVYDKLLVDNIHFSGLRWIAKLGFLSDQSGYSHAGEAEAFYYSLHGPRLNFGAHAFVGSRGSSSVFAQYFLGGFDSVRGLPDGALYGPKAAYVNLEARYLMAKFRYLWIQAAAFADAGSAGESLTQLAAAPRTALGFGVRLAVPQVYRLMLRIDYAQSLERGASRGISAGLEQFFQPYRPL